MTEFLPHIRQEAVDAGRRFTPQFYDALRRAFLALQSRQDELSSAQEAIRAILQSLGAEDVAQLESLGSLLSGKQDASAVLDAVAAMVGTGIAVYTPGAFVGRSIVSVAGETTVSNGSGLRGNPAVGLADLPDPGTGSLLAITRDAKGRVSGSRAATAVDLAGLTLTAGVDVSALRMIVAEAGNGRYPSLSTPSDAGRVVGMSVSAATTGNSFATITRGEWMDAGWAWVPGPIFCGADGALTQTPPVGWVLEVGRAISATRALIDIKTPLKRA